MEKEGNQSDVKMSSCSSGCNTPRDVMPDSYFEDQQHHKKCHPVKKQSRSLGMAPTDSMQDLASVICDESAEHEMEDDCVNCSPMKSTGSPKEELK